MTASSDQTARIWDVELIGVYRLALRDRSCAEKFVGAQELTDQELADPILRGITQTIPCERRGPLSWEYWTRLVGLARTP